ncbi:MAG: hypothetical protein JO227_13655 [Acetobacteraceae bacterium]|nr:hypothetical protein [Acetobacteraceae bacterium]
MEETLQVVLDDDARKEIVAEFGSMNEFYSRLESVVSGEAGTQASVSPSSEEGARGGGLIEIITAVSGLIAALSPVVIAWIRSRGFEIEEKTETRKSGTVVRTVRVRRGPAR